MSVISFEEQKALILIDCNLFIFKFFKACLFSREREREGKQGRGREREGDTGSEAGSRL